MSVAQLGYLGFEVRDVNAWRRFTLEVLGLMPGALGDDHGFTARNDGYAQRLIVTEGSADDLSVIGWLCKDDAALLTTVERLRAAGTDVTEGSAEMCAQRRVARLVCFADPAGIPSELCVGLQRATEPFHSDVVRGGFVAEDAGLGHLVISANSQAESRKFYEQVLGFRLSDHIRCEIHGFKVDIAFFHTNPRHHTVAFGDQQRKRLHHFMVEARSMDDVGLAFDRTLRAGLPIMQTLGRHPNDRMFSFYAQTPSRFQFEFGWGGREVDDATWQPGEYDQISEWGHHPPQFLLPQKK